MSNIPCEEKSLSNQQLIERDKKAIVFYEECYVSVPMKQKTKKKKQGNISLHVMFKE